ncbi:ferritin-like catalase Nec2 [Magnolia sinica]|uniref:ferritin-like catalase Nec2 n=1 Tax=Magnolia sinica TaxID=86752 RepID=UPI00265AF451|nr:ferritin-like catalase Nec2 [Magnolia sinica]
MAVSTFSVSLLFFFLCLGYFAPGCLTQNPTCAPRPPANGAPIFPNDVEKIRFALNLEHLEADFFLFGALGYGLDGVAPELAQGGPPPIGAKKANLDNHTRQIIAEFGYQEVGHLRAIKSTVGGFARPVIDLSAKNFATIFDNAFEKPLSPPFDPYISSVNYLLASYVIPYVGLVAYVGTNPNINGYVSKRLLAGLLAVESGQDAVIRALLYQRADELVPPYKHTVAEFTARLSDLRNRLANCGIKDEGLFVPLQLGAENKTTSNILSANADSVAYARTPAEILRMVYGTGNESKPGGFLPKGGSGRIARGFLKKL